MPCIEYCPDKFYSLSPSRHKTSKVEICLKNEKKNNLNSIVVLWFDFWKRNKDLNEQINPNSIGVKNASIVLGGDTG